MPSCPQASRSCPGKEGSNFPAVSMARCVPWRLGFPEGSTLQQPRSGPEKPGCRAWSPNTALGGWKGPGHLQSLKPGPGALCAHGERYSDDCGRSGWGAFPTCRAPDRPALLCLDGLQLPRPRAAPGHPPQVSGLSVRQLDSNPKPRQDDRKPHGKGQARRPQPESRTGEAEAGGLRESEASLAYTARTCLKKKGGKLFLFVPVR